MAGALVDTLSGRLQGDTEANGVQVFRGIPYGMPAGGIARFFPPQRAQSWAGARDATQFGAICPQQGPVADQSLADQRTIGYLPALPQDEDCLFLNVWTPDASSGRRPVMVWLHGRGYAAGAGSEGWYNGAALARRGDVVVVTVNHRLNVFGYLHLGDLGGSDFAASGVAGLLDIVLALEWVRDNIQQFGGDPDNVTIFGESGGGSKVSHLLAMPSARGLFHRAIVQSGPGLRAVDRAEAADFAERLCGHLGIKQYELHKLQFIAPQQLLEAVAAVSATATNGAGPAGPMMRLAPVMDGTFLPQHPFDPVAAPAAAHVPLLIGTNKDEAALFMAGDPRRRRLEEQELIERLRPQLGDRLDEILAVYRRERPNATPWDLLIAINSERTHLASIQLAERKAAGGHAAVYMYLFAWESDHLGGLFKSAHAMEIPFVFDQPDVAPMTGTKPDRYQLAERMSLAWAAFARTGNPNHPGLPDWPPFTAAVKETMIFDSECRIENDPRAAERDVWAVRAT